MKDFFKKHKEIISYLFFGGVTTLVNIAVYAVCYELFKIANTHSVVISWVVSVCVAFVTNKLFVFESKAKNKIAIKEAVGFFLARTATGLMDMGIMYVFVDILLFDGTLMKVLSNILVIILNYFASKIIIFKNPR